jgi:two-component sensor histidine kinase
MRHGEQDTDRLYTDEPADEIDEQELIEQLPDDLDPHEMADSIPDEIVAEEGQDLGLDPDLAVFAAQEELPDEDL